MDNLVNLAAVRNRQKPNEIGKAYFNSITNDLDIPFRDEFIESLFAHSIGDDLELETREYTRICSEFGLGSDVISLVYSRTNTSIFRFFDMEKDKDGHLIRGYHWSPPYTRPAKAEPWYRGFISRLRWLLR